MQIRVRIFWHVIIDDYVDSLYIHTTTEQVCCHQYPFIEVLKGLVFCQSGKIKKTF